MFLFEIQDLITDCVDWGIGNLCHLKGLKNIVWDEKWCSWFNLK